MIYLDPKDLTDLLIWVGVVIVMYIIYRVTLKLTKK